MKATEVFKKTAMLLIRKQRLYMKGQPLDLKSAFYSTADEPKLNLSEPKIILPAECVMQEE